MVFGGRSDCQHIWDNVQYQRRSNDSGKSAKQLSNRGSNNRDEPIHYAFCQLCNAWSGNYGLEPTISLYVQHSVEIARELRRVLRSDGVMWWNLGDSYATSRNGRSAADTKAVGKDDRTFRDKPFSVTELPAKNLCMIPARVAIALQDDGWILRSEMGWYKGNAMPSSVTDRPGTAHEHVFMLVKSARYYFDMMAVRRDHKPESIERDKAGYNAAFVGRHTVPWDNRQHSTDKDGFCNPAGRALRTSDPFFDSLDAYIAHLQDIRDNGGMLVDSEGLPAALIVNTESYSSAAKEDQSLPHYAADRDRPYRVSPDCPIHSPRFESQSPDTLGYDEQQAGRGSGNLDTDVGHGQEPLLESPSSLGHDNRYDPPSTLDSAGLETSHLQSPESIGDCKKEVSPSEPTSYDETQSRTSRTSESGEHQDYKKDSQGRGYSPSATDRNTQTHKTDLVHSTSPLDTASAQMSFHTGDKPMLPLLSDSVERTHESNTLGDSASYEQGSNPSGQTVPHSERKQNVPYSNCTCIWQKVKTDHYATFPRKLIAPLIKTMPERVCPACNSPWQRVVKKSGGLIGKGWTKHTDDLTKGMTQTFRADGGDEPYQVTTTGWRPTCKCIQKCAPNFGMKGVELLELADEVAKELAPIGGIILDPFCGSGTVGAVCNEHGRRFIGIDLSARYLAENALPRSEKKMSQSALSQLPLFGKPA